LRNAKKGIRIVNFSRAALFDETALVAALKDGTVECYVTDFPTNTLMSAELAELRQQNRLITIPHLGASTPDSEDNCATMAAIQLREYLLYGNIKNSVNFPDCELPYMGNKRLCFIHKNVVNVVSSITHILSEMGLNIDNMENRSRGDFAYTIIDIDGEPEGNLTDAFRSLDTIVKVRVI